MCVYLPLLLGLQSLQELDLFFRLHIDPDNLVSGRHFNVSEHYYVGKTFFKDFYTVYTHCIVLIDSFLFMTVYIEFSGGGGGGWGWGVI